MKRCYKLYDKVRGYVFEFKTKQQLKIEVAYIKNEYENVKLIELNECEYEVSYHD